MSRADSRLARAQAAAAAITDAACAGRGLEWDRLERAHRRAGSAEAAQALLDGVAARFCDVCPAILRCAKYAQEAEYSGVAAAAAYRDGQRLPVGWVAPRPGPARRAS